MDQIQMNNLPDDDDQLTQMIVDYLKRQGIFDGFRKDCLADVDTKPSYLNLMQRIEGYVSRFLSQKQWSQSMNKNQLRESLRRQINDESGIVKYGIEHLVDQVINPKIKSQFTPQIESVVKKFLGIEEEKEDEIVWPEKEKEKPTATNLPNTPDRSEVDEKQDEEHIEMQIDSSDDDVKPDVLELQKKADEVKQSTTSGDITEIKEEEIISEDSNMMIDESNSNDTASNDCSREDSQESSTTDSKTETFTELRKEVRNPKDDVPKSESSIIASTEQIPKIPQESKKETERRQKDTKVMPKTVPASKSSTKVTSQAAKKLESAQNSPIPSSSSNKEKSNKSKLPAKQLKPSATKDKERSKSQKTTHRKSRNDDYLSDVSSAHISDMSDFDDRSGLSSDCDTKNTKRTASKEIKKSELSESKKSEPKAKLQQKESRNIEIGSTKSAKRERKMNPKYTSSEYSSMFNKKSRNIQGQNNDSSESEEGSKESSSSSSKASTSERVIIKTEETDDVEVNKSKKKSKQRLDGQTQRYDASDLYKPRPVISNSRRNRGTKETSID